MIIVRVATTLREASRELTPSTTAASDLDSMKRKRIENAEAIRNAVEQEHKRALARKLSSKRRMEEAERLLGGAREGGRGKTGGGTTRARGGGS